MKFRRFSAVCVALFAAGAGTAFADPKGLWLAQDGAATCAWRRVRRGLVRLHRQAEIAGRSGNRPAVDRQKQSRSGATRPAAGRRRCLIRWCRTGRGDGRDGSTTSTTAMVMRDVCSSLARRRSGSKAAPSAFAAARICRGSSSAATPQSVIASEAKQSRAACASGWIASSLSLLAMTRGVRSDRNDSTARAARSKRSVWLPRRRGTAPWPC